MARSRETLTAAGVTHVLNATAFASANYFCASAGAPPGAPAVADGGPALSYKALWLQDTPGEDLGCVLYDVFDWLDGVRECGGTALVHCSQGVSRSVALCIAYLMWRDGEGYDDAFARVKAARGVANPNMGFACQLLQWAKRRCAMPDGARLYRIAPHSAADPRYLVPRQASRPLLAALDSRFAYVVHAPDALYIWRGAACGAPFVAAACTVAAQLAKYEAAPLPARCVDCGSEPAELLDALGVPPEVRGPDGVGLLGATTLRVAALDDELTLYASGRRSDLALRGGVAAQENAIASAGGGASLLQHGPPEENELDMRSAPRMSMPAFATTRSLESTAVRRPRAIPRFSSPAGGFNAPSSDCQLEAAVEERDPSQLFAFPSLEVRASCCASAAAFLTLSRRSACCCSTRTTCNRAARTCCCQPRAPCTCGLAPSTRSSSAPASRHRRPRRASRQPRQPLACQCRLARRCRWSWTAASQPRFGTLSKRELFLIRVDIVA